jgi:hypothetical protein
MNRQYIDDHHVVARYLAHQLADAERSEFEAYFLKHPEMVEELEQAAQMKAGLMRLRATGELNFLLQPQPTSGHRRWRFGELRGTLGGMLAAIVVLLVGAGLWMNRQPAGSEQWLAPTPASLLGPMGKPLHVGDTYTILRTRGEAADVDIELPKVPQALRLRVLPESMSQPAVYRVALYAVDGTVVDGRELHEVAMVGGLIPAEDEFVSVYVDASKVKPGRYRLAIQGAGNGELRSVFAVRFY